jgi:hypothetical protein
MSALMLRTSSNLFASSIRRIFVTWGCDLAKCGKRHPGDFLMQLSSAIRAVMIALTVTGVGLATAYADGGGIRL